MAECDLSRRDAQGCVKLSSLVGCDLVVPDDGGLCFTASAEIYDKHGHVLDGDHDPAGKDGCDHRDTPEWKAEHPAGVRRIVGQRAEWDAGASAVDAAEKESTMSEKEAAAPAAPATVESIGVDAAVSQVKSLVPADASPALLLGGAALLAVVGAAIKLGPGVLKARAEARERDHEARMKELELRERESEKKQDDHGSCAAERATLSAKVTAVEAKVSELTRQLDEVGRKAEKAVSSVPQFDEDFDPAALEKRLAKLEKAHKAAPKKR